MPLRSGDGRSAAGDASGPSPEDGVARASQGIGEEVAGALPGDAVGGDQVTKVGRAMAWLRARVLAVPDDVDPIEFGGRALLYVAMVWVGIQSVLMPIEHGALAASKLHLIHLIFHEAGHVVFRVLGDFMAVAGGTLMQLLMPALFLVTFVLKYRNAYGGAVTLWWLGHSAVDVAPYAYDARAQKLLLLGGVTGRDVPGYHDWHNLLGRLRWLQHDHLIARLFHGVGTALIVLALVWGAYLLWRQWGPLRRGPAYGEVGGDGAP